MCRGVCYSFKFFFNGRSGSLVFVEGFGVCAGGVCCVCVLVLVFGVFLRFVLRGGFWGFYRVVKSVFVFLVIVIFLG